MKANKIFVFVLMVCLSIAFAYAANTPVGGNVTESNEGTLTESSATSVVAAGGNVSDLAIDIKASTKRWQGFVGNVTGNLSLGRNADILYDFGVADVKTVFATTNNAFDWANLVAGTASAVDTVWSFANGKDQAADAFTGSQTIEGVSSVPAATLAGTFYTGILTNGTAAAKSDFVFGAPIIQAGQAGFDSATYQYEIIVPTTTRGTDTYYFYVSLDE